MGKAQNAQGLVCTVNYGFDLITSLAFWPLILVDQQLKLLLVEEPLVWPLTHDIIKFAQLWLLPIQPIATLAHAFVVTLLGCILLFEELHHGSIHVVGCVFMMLLPLALTPQV